MRRSRSGRGLSPVIGTVLLVAIVVLLATTGAYIVFGLTEEREPAPNVALELDETDDPVAHELTVDSGETLEGEKLELRGTAVTQPVEDRLKAGETVRVYPVETDVRVVWFGEHGSSYVLEEFDPEPSLPPVDERCNWVESQGSDPTVDGIVVDCNVLTGGDVNTINDGVVIGEVDSDQSTVTLDTGAVYGHVEAKGDADVQNAFVAGDVESTANSVDVVGSNVSGNVIAEDDVTVDGNRIRGDVVASDVDLDAVVVHGSVKSTGPVNLDGVTIHGHVYASSGSLSCTDSPTINGEPCSSYTPKDPDDY
ncbi:hypothetical protein BRC79_02810 [Halobacteriales archaeon QH_8_67_27]|nr:MAG: hypothetical protein BRC79_02810 [Halobacteriales archaeon QH_8_67_27]